MEIIQQHTLCQKIESKIAQNVKYPNFYPNRRPFWICLFSGGGTLVFELFSIFSSKMGSLVMKSPLNLEFMMIWNYDPL